MGWLAVVFHPLLLFLLLLLLLLHYFIKKNHTRQMNKNPSILIFTSDIRKSKFWSRKVLALLEFPVFDHLRRYQACLQD
ncbi:hypothetical protein BKA57DRAFT_223663 [Linnemannia elongata]|nr:hypothetical protein BKA57DRAFT_223663 [Linnemannia elongata]